jgi:hypothetical protein
MNLIKIRRYFKWLRLKFVKSLRFSGTLEERYKRPKNLNDIQTCSVDIAVKSIHNPNSKLYYDIVTQECYVKTEDEKVGTIYVFLESQNIKIINTVFGYDIFIDEPTESYVFGVFRKEMSKRRAQFKKEALLKVDYSLHKVLDKLNDI